MTMKANFKSVEVKKTVSVEENQVTLVLSEDEAVSLLALAGAVRGENIFNPEYTPREITASLFHALGSLREHHKYEAYRLEAKSGRYRLAD